MKNPGCAELDERLEELALGEVVEPARSRLLAHVSACGECRGRLDAMLGLTDSLLALAPAHEPPPGFETRVLERLGMAQTQAPRHRRARWLAVAAAVAILAALVGGVALGRRGGNGAQESAVRTGEIVRADGSHVGSIRLVDAPQPYALVMIEHPQPGTDSVTCRLELPGGRMVDVGSWGYDDVKAGVWAVGLDDELLAAVVMQVVDQTGKVLATATLN